MRCAITGWLRPPKKLNKLVDQPPLRGISGNRGLEDVRVPIFFDPANRLFRLQPIHHRLDGRVRRTILLGETFLDFADRRLRRASTARP